MLIKRSESPWYAEVTTDMADLTESGLPRFGFWPRATPGAIYVRLALWFFSVTLGYLRQVRA